MGGWIRAHGFAITLFVVSSSIYSEEPPATPTLFREDAQFFRTTPEQKPAIATSEQTTATAKSASMIAPLSAPAAPLSKQRRQRRAKWSETLQVPAALVIDPNETITLGDLLERIRQQHGLPVRVDLPHVLPITALTEMVATKITPQSSTPTVSSPMTLPFGVNNTYSSEPLSPSALPAVMPPNAIPQFAPVYSPAVPALVAPSNGNTAYKPVAASDDDQPVSAIKAEVITEPIEPSAKAEPVTASAEENPKSDANPAMQAIQKMLTEMLKTPVDVAVITQQEATVEDVLRQAFDRSFPLQALINTSISAEFPMLTSLSRATEWDLLVQDDGVLLTTRLNANLHKETRVYSVKPLEKSAGLKAEDVARVLTRTVRPWSWKKNFSEAVAAKASTAPNDKTKTGTKTGKTYTLPKINLDLSSVMSLISAAKATTDHHLRLVSDEASPPSNPTATASDQVELTEEHLELLGRAWDGLFQGTVSSIQVIYHADPPTGVIEVLPGMLIISQSQSAHREISDLLDQLSQPEN